MTRHIHRPSASRSAPGWPRWPGPSTPVDAAETRDLILAAYSVPKEAYERRIIPAFQRQWKQKTGQDVRVRSSYGASGAQARAMIGGFDADVAVLSLEGDVDQIVKAGLITHDWRKAPHGGMISASVVALGVRKGNPKGSQGLGRCGAPRRGSTLPESQNLRRRDVGCDRDLWRRLETGRAARSGKAGRSRSGGRAGRRLADPHPTQRQGHG